MMIVKTVAAESCPLMAMASDALCFNAALFSAGAAAADRAPFDARGTENDRRTGTQQASA
jgi:hypothetical protein